MCDAIAEFGEGFLGALGLRPPLGGTTTRDDGEIAVHHDGVLDEHAVGTFRRWLDLGHPPTGTDKRPDIALPLRHRDVGVDGRPLDVSDESLGQARTGPAY